MYYIYMLKCIDDSLYTGSARDVRKRLKEHFTQNSRCAKYTRSHPPREVVAIWRCDTKSEATKVEYHIKQLTKSQKELLYLKNEAPEGTLEKLQGIVLSRLTEGELSDIVDFL